VLEELSYCPDVLACLSIRVRVRVRIRVRVRATDLLC